MFVNGILNAQKYRQDNSDTFQQDKARPHVARDNMDYLGPISSTSLRRVFVLKTSYEVRTLKIGFHQTIELCELLTFCRIFKTTM